MHAGRIAKGMLGPCQTSACMHRFLEEQDARQFAAWGVDLLKYAHSSLASAITVMARRSASVLRAAQAELCGVLYPGHLCGTP